MQTPVHGQPEKQYLQVSETSFSQAVSPVLSSGTLLCWFLAYTYYHRWALLLKQQSLLTIYHLPTKENILPFSISVCSKHMEVCCFRFLFAANKRKLAVSFFHLQQTNRSCHFPLVPFSISTYAKWNYIYCT